MTQSNIQEGFLPDQDLIDGFVSLILEIQPKANSNKVLVSVQNKVNGLTAQEPFFLRAVLANKRLSASDKVSKYIGVHTEWDADVRYPDGYHHELLRQTSILLEESV